MLPFTGYFYKGAEQYEYGWRLISLLNTIIFFIFMWTFSNNKDFKLWAKREHIYVDGKAFVKAEFRISFPHPVLRVSTEQRFEIDEPLSDVQLTIRMFLDGIKLFYSIVDLFLFPISIFCHKNRGWSDCYWYCGA